MVALAEVAQELSGLIGLCFAGEIIMRHTKVEREIPEFGGTQAFHKQFADTLSAFRSPAMCAASRELDAE